MTTQLVYTLEYAASDGPLVASPTWTAINPDDVLSVSVSMGRQSETDRTTQPSTMTVRLDNSRRDYDPALSPNLLPSRQVRLTVRHPYMFGADSWYSSDSIETGDEQQLPNLIREYVLFRGVVNPDGWQQVDYQHPAVSSCIITCIDLLGHVAQRTADYPLFENQLYQIALREGVLGDTGSNTPNFENLHHFPLGDNQQDSYYGSRTFWNDNYFSGQMQPSYVAHDAPNLTTETLPTNVYSSSLVRPIHGGSLDGWLGCAVLRSDGWPNRSDAPYDHWSLGVAMHLRSLPAVDKTGIEESGGAGFFLDRDGTLSFSAATTPTYISSPAGTLKPGRTYTIAATWDGSAGGSGGVLRLYVNGSEVASSTSYATTTSGFQGLLSYLGAKVGEPRMDVLYNDHWYMPATLAPHDLQVLHELWLGAKGTLTGKAAGLLCDAIGLPHNIGNVGRIGIAEIQDGQPNIGSLLQTIERTERGRLYYDHRTEQVAMVSWADLVVGARHSTVQLKLSDDPAETGDFLRYSNPQLGTVKPVTQATVSADGLTEMSGDLTARNIYGQQAINYSTLAGVGFDASSLAGTEVYRNSEPATVVRSLVVDPTTDGDYTLLLNLELFDLVELTRTPHDIGSQQTIKCLVEGLSLSVGAGMADWRANLFLTTASHPDGGPGSWGTLQWNTGANASKQRIEA